MNISQAAAVSGVSAKMIRHYEQIGLIPEAKRTFSNYRTYAANEIHILRFIRTARDLGFSVKQIAELLKLWGDRRRTSREIKALSADEVKQYLSGAGMGYAKAAELNHFPGPMHVLELADKLSLTPYQRSEVMRLMETHKVEARTIGARLVEAERALDALFRGGNVGYAALADAVRAAAAGEYRLSHLETHRGTRALLAAGQIARYDELRGYAKPAAAEDAHRRH